jgi:hypothetical protein
MTPPKRGRNMVAAVTDTAMYQNCSNWNRYELGWLSRASMKACVRFVVAVETKVDVVDVVAACMAAATVGIGLCVLKSPTFFEDAEVAL